MIHKLGNSFMIKKKEIDNKSNNLKAVGLRSILVHHFPKESNVVVKQSMKLTSSISTANSNISSFLKSCFLCNKNLCPHEDIYMYRGDQGYCSIECRQKQIDIDERRELEASTKQILASFRRCHDDGPTETRLLLDDLRRHHNRLPRPRFREVVS